MITLTGRLERVVFHNPENHYMIARLRSDESKKDLTVVGVMPGVNAGEILTVTGDWETHVRYGEQFKVFSFEVVLPATVDGIEKYLKSGIIKGIGEKIADRLVSHFQDQTLDIIDKHPQRLLEVEGVGPKTADRIVAAWEAHHGIRELMDFLYEYNISPAFGSKLLRHYGDKALSVVRNSPYQLCRDIPEFDFHHIDYLAGKMGIPKEDPDRIDACIGHQLRVFIEDGNTYMPKGLLMERLNKRFGIEPTVAEPVLEDMILDHWLVEELAGEGQNTVCIFPVYIWEAEKQIANRIGAMLTVPVKPHGLNSQQIRSELASRMAIIPSEEQLHILEDVLDHRIAIITGGPGTGKTTLIRSITSLLTKLGKKILLAAPTGRAARRLSEVTLRPAETLHKMLRYNLSTGEFDKNQDDPLEADTIIVDEASMVDTLLMAQLISAVSMGSRLILVGDVFQLPAIGPGNVLSDMISSGCIPSFELKTIFRQAHESPIVLSAHKIRKGEMPELKPYTHPKDQSEFFFIEEDNLASAVDTIVELCTRTFPDQLKLDPINDVQVITPMHKGEVGTLNLNQVLQKKMNPAGQKKKVKGGRFKIYDKVMHLKNNYQKEVFNGDIGTICEIDTEKDVLTVNYDNRRVSYGFDETDELSLAYAISVHKSQGSEYPAVIIPMMTQHFMLLQRNLLYTAITRGSRLVVVIGTRKALQIALNNNKPQLRLSLLASRLAGRNG